MLRESISLSVIFSFLASEFLGIATGGMVSAGYLALLADEPFRLLSTLVVALVIYFAVLLLQRKVILYGRRRFMAAVLLSLAGTWGIEQLFFYANAIGQDLRVVGYIIPGLIANDMLRQSPWKTILGAALVAVLIRVILLAPILR